MKAFDKEIQPLYRSIENASDIRDIEVPELDDLSILEAYRKLYMSAAFDFAMRARKQTRKMTKGEDEIFEDIITQEILTYITQDVGSTITAMGNTSKELIQRYLRDLVPEILDQGIGGSQATTMLRDRIASRWHEAKRFRVERIARTEVNRASSFGSWKGIKSVSEDQNKIWISAFASDSRQGHMDADGQKRDINEPFDINGENLQYPSDPAGSGGNTINCLCSMYYEAKI